MRDGYDTFALVWCERNIEVGYQANWLNSGQVDKLSRARIVEARLEAGTGREIR